MAANKFLVFDEARNGIMTDAEYLANIQRLNGVEGIADPRLHNKIYRQSSIVAAAIGKVIADGGVDADDQSAEVLAEAIKRVLASATQYGSFTPVIYGATTNPVYTASVATGSYSIVDGRVLTIQLGIQLSSLTTAGSGQIRIGGLPAAIMSRMPAGALINGNYLATYLTTGATEITSTRAYVSVGYITMSYAYGANAASWGFGVDRLTASSTIYIHIPGIVLNP